MTRTILSKTNDWKRADVIGYVFDLIAAQGVKTTTKNFNSSSNHEEEPENEKK